MSTPTPTMSEAQEAGGRTHLVGRVLVLLALLALVTFWVWALFFASKTAVNKVEDRQWAERAEATCAEVKIQLRELDEQTSTDLDERAALVEQSTDLLSQMLDDITVVMPTDEKGRAIAPEWVADYRTLLEDRYEYAAMLRSGVDGPFTETAVNNVPITERIETFAGDNEMSSCSPPRGSVL